MIDRELENRLLRDRIDRMQRTIEAYEASIHTDYIDRIRRSNDTLELALYDVLAALGVVQIPGEDAVRALIACGIREARAREIQQALSKKISL